MSCFPVFVLDFLYILDPKIGNTHREAVVKSHSSIGYRLSQSRHTGHVFGNSNGIGFDLMNKFVGKGEIHDSIAVLVAVIIRAVAVEVLS